MKELTKKTATLALLLSFMICGGLFASVQTYAEDGDEISVEDTSPANTTIEDSSEEVEDTSLSDDE
jgi:hypothetical protein